MESKLVMQYDPDVFDALSEKEWRRAGKTWEDKLEVNREERQELENTMNGYLLERNRPRGGQQPQGLISVVIFGKTGSGKSSIANTLVGANVFEVSDGFASCTQYVEPQIVDISGARYRILDTPGLFDTKKDVEEIKFELSKVITECPDGIHAFLFVANGDVRFSPEERETLQVLQNLFGDDVKRFSCLILTRADAFLKGSGEENKTLEEHLRKCHEVPDLEEFVKKIDGRVMAVNSKSSLRFIHQFNRRAILDMIQVIQEQVGFKPYTSRLFEEAKRKRQIAEQERINRLREEKRLEAERIRNFIKKIEETSKRHTVTCIQHMTLEELETARKYGFSELIDQVKAKVCRELGVADDANVKDTVRDVVPFVVYEKEVSERIRKSEEDMANAAQEAERLKAELRIKEEQEALRRKQEEYDEAQRQLDIERQRKMEAMKDLLHKTLVSTVAEYVNAHKKTEVENMGLQDFRGLASSVLEKLPHNTREEFTESDIVEKLRVEINTKLKSMEYTFGEKLWIGLTYIPKKIKEWIDKR